MKFKYLNKNKLFIYCVFLLILLIVSFSIYSFISDRLTLGATDSWDGVSVATSFSSGNGSIDNPYVISSPEEFMFFKSLIEGDSYTIYQDKYYILGADLDFGNNSISSIGTLVDDEERFFKGNFDGNGYELSNINNSSSNVIHNVDCYGLFSIVQDAVIKNLSITNFNIHTEANDATVSIGTLAAQSIISDTQSVDVLSSFTNIKIYNFNIDYSSKVNEGNFISGFISSISSNTVVDRVYLNGNIVSSENNNLNKISNSLNSDISNIVCVINDSDIPLYDISENDITATNVYEYKNGNYYSNGSICSVDDIMNNFNSDSSSDYYWDFSLENPTLSIGSSDIVESPSSMAFAFSMDRNIPLHDSSIEGDTIYINDLDSDYYYYTGLNYADTRSTGVLPTGNNLNLYNDSNLVKVYIKYDGSDVNDSDLIGYVSLDEQVSTFIYYKYFVKNGDYLEFELIDNPYADRPDDKYFQGWATDYEGAIITYDSDKYVRKVRIPVASSNISITFKAIWGNGISYNYTSANTSWSTVNNELNSVGMIPIGEYTEVTNIDMDLLYIQRNVDYLSRFTSGAVSVNGDPLTGRCTSLAGCISYIKATAYDSSATYYQLIDGTMEEQEVYLEERFVDVLPENSIVAGYYRKVSLTRGDSIAGYYDSMGVMQTSGSCSSSSCEYYELMQYYDADSQYNLSSGREIFYYLVTRDTNIVVLRTAISGNMTLSKPFTLTGISNGVNYNGIYNISSSYISPKADFRVEYIAMNATSYKYNDQSYVTTSVTSSRNIYGNWNNIKIGRGITHNDGYLTASSIIGGNNSSTGSSTSLTRYRIIVESGYYNFGSASSTNGSNSVYIDGDMIWGSDFDRISDPETDDLDVYFATAGSYGGNLRSNDANGISIHTTIKSGKFGTSKYDYSTGVYVGGRKGGTYYSAKEITIEGGWIYNLVGGPVVASNRGAINDTYIYMKGGTVEQICAGAGLSATYGNRIVSITGGQVNYSVFGGSNGSSGSNGDGTIVGASFIYVGGDAIIGNDSNIANSSTLNGVESGSVFGIGNGRNGTNYTDIGSMKSSHIVIDGNAIIKGNVYGGGNYGHVGISSYTSSSIIDILGGHIVGSLYGGGNNNGSGTSSIASSVYINMFDGTIDGSIYGGSRSKGIIYGNTNIEVTGGIVRNDIYGGGEGGYSSNSSGTFVQKNVDLVVGVLNGDNDITIEGSVYGGSAYGATNTSSTSQNTSNYTTNVTINGGVIKKSVFGGGKGDSSYTPVVAGDITVTIHDGSIGNVFGGFDAAGKPSKGDIVYLNGGTIGSAFGGGNNTDQSNTDIRLIGSNVSDVYGGSNENGTVTESNVTVTGGKVGNIYGGNNIAGTTITSNVIVTGIDSISGDIYGGGKQAFTTTSNVEVSDVIVNDIYGGGKQAGLTTTNVNIANITAKNVFGGSNESGSVEQSNVKTVGSNLNSLYGGNNQGGSVGDAKLETSTSVITNVFGGGDNASTTTANLIVQNGEINFLFGGGNQAGVVVTNVDINGGKIGDVFGGSNESGNITTANIKITENEELFIDNVYGGNNEGGYTETTNVTILSGTIGTVFGGGNQAEVGSTNVITAIAYINDLYGGGNAAGVQNNTFVDIDGTTILNNIYGGGNEGVVTSNTEVFVTDAIIQGNAFAGGNGGTAVVSGNSTITIDGNTIVGLATSIAPDGGCVFGSGNAASTGVEAESNSTATVNIVGGTIYGNVYGGPKMAVVYGVTKTNIGTGAINISNLKENDIVVSGTVFGGGESNASGSDVYDFSFISVTNGITVNVNGEGYIENGHNFIINGSIFGSGNASSSAGDSNIYINNLGTRDKPNKSISIQRATNLEISSSCIELEGTTDRTNEYSDIKYSLNMIDKLVVKNDTTLLLQHNANMLKEFYSGVDVNGELVPATVDIDDESKTVTRNVNNRIYMIPNQNLNVTINQAATAYGKVTGMTFFGMYNSYSSGSYGYGVYDEDVHYGDIGNAGMAIIGGSYVLGLHSVDHDITKDGFYSNYLSDDFTEISTSYIDPSPVGDTGYRWIIGLSAVSYNFSLTASKYSSLGTYELQMMDFADGNTIFDVIGFNSEGLGENVQLVDSSDVPRVGKTEDEANNIFGLSVKSETQEWTSYGTTKLLSVGNGQYEGTEEYITDSRKLPPSLMFYLYHAKNISREDDIGTVVLMLQAAIPVNQIDYKIQLITITIDLYAKKYEDADSYDASITYDKRYEMPSSTLVNITNQSQFSAYFSLISWNDKFENIYGKNNSNYHVLITDYPLPVGTMITMLDFAASENRPEYYYYTVTQAIYDDSLRQLEEYNEITYRLSDFVKMGSTSINNTYDDQEANLKYYSDSDGMADEEFMFIFDMKNTTSTGEHLDHSILFELRNSEDRTVFSVLGIRQGIMLYSTYDNSNAVLNQVIEGNDQYLYYNIADEMSYSTNVQYNQTENRQSIIDTNYESSSMGLNVALYSADGKIVSSSLLSGTSILINDKEYFADSDGVFRINLAGKVSNLNKSLTLTVDKDLPSGDYTIKYTLFASDDGLHNSLPENSVTTEFPVTVVGSDNSITVTCDDENKLVDGDNIKNMNGSNINSYNVKYVSQLNNPNLRVEVFKRDISTIDSTKFDSVPFNSLFSNNLSVYQENEMLLDMEGNDNKIFNFELNDALISGTYRIEFKLYDNNQLIDSDIKYVIVKKSIKE